MSNAVYTMVIAALAQVVSDRAAEHMLRGALDEAGLAPETVSAQAMQEVLAGSLLGKLSSVMPPARARQTLRALSFQLYSHYPKAPTLFGAEDEAASGWDTSALTQPASGETLNESDFEWDADDFEFDDPEEEGLRTTIALRHYALDTASGQEALLADLARQRGVIGVVICDRQGQLLRARASRGAQQLGEVVAASARLLGERRWRVLCAELGAQTVCIRPLGGHFVALLASGSSNLGRLIAELGAVQEAA